MTPRRGERPPAVAALRPGNAQETEKRALREVMAQFATGITVLTAGGATPHGMTANSFTSVSLEPPMVLCCVARTARMHGSIGEAGHFGVSVLGAEQETLARHFASRGREPGMAQFEGVDWFAGRHTGVPLLAGSLAWLECDLAETYEGGDHSIFLGTVRAAILGRGRPLLFHGGGIHRHDTPPARSA